MKLAEVFLDSSFQFVRRVRVASVEIKWKSNRIAVFQTCAPTRRNEQGRLHMFIQQIGMTHDLGRLLPLEGRIRGQFTHEFLARRRLVAILQQGRDVARFRRLEGVAEDQGEDRRQNEQEDENAPVAIDVDELLHRHTADRLQGRAAVHRRAS